MKEESLESIKNLYGINEKNILTVSQITGYIKNKLTIDPQLKKIYVLGEITNISKPNSGHIYFDIKDENSLLNCVFFKGNNHNLSFEIENGLEVLVLGSITTYEKKSNYQLNVSLISPIGAGAFFLKFNQLKEKLSKEGLFDEKHKKKITLLPRSVGLITSKNSSVIKDVFKVLDSRFSNINIKLVVTSMQGDNASKEIIKAINILNRFEYVDTIIIARGGGAIEDLTCFNDEELARTIFKSRIPIVTGIGHETDSTIADFVADKRASTPSVAAKMAVPDKQELLDKINLLRTGLRKSYYGYNHFIKSKREEILEKINSLRAELKKSYNNHNNLIKSKQEELLEKVNSLRGELRKSYHNFIRSKQKERENKKYKLIIMAIVIIVALYLIIKILMGD